MYLLFFGGIFYLTISSIPSKKFYKKFKLFENTDFLIFDSGYLITL